MEDKSFKDLIEGIDSPLANNTDEQIDAEPEINVVEEPAIENINEDADAPVVEESAPTGDSSVCIVDETTTTFVMEDEPVKQPSAPVSAPQQQQQPQETPAPAPKKDKSKQIKALQIAIICVVSIVTLWLAMFTVDHTLAANGLAPLFCKLTAEYEDGSASYKGIGYKVQFKFDANGNLTQSVILGNKTGPNDVNTLQ